MIIHNSVTIYCKVLFVTFEGIMVRGMERRKVVVWERKEGRFERGGEMEKKGEEEDLEEK
jgi:hypothetical protein